MSELETCPDADAPAADAYLSFRSPYSYLALDRMVSWERQGRVRWNVKFVSPLAIRRPEHFARNAPLARPYFLRDSARTAQYLGVPFRRPVPDPIVQDPVTLAIPQEQPYIHRLTRLGAVATRRGRPLPFALHVMRLIWDGTVDAWNEGDHLSRAAERAGLDLADMEREVAADEHACDALIERHEQEQKDAGHWGVPLFVYQGEPFFGQDRMDVLMWRIGKSREQRGTTQGVKA